jgi:hypothetical protein
MDAMETDAGGPELARRLHGLTVRRAGLALGLWGEAGVGKSRAVETLLREVPCRSLSVHSTVPLADLVRALPRPARLAAGPTRTAERLLQGELLPVSECADALAAVLSASSPFILHLEDLHEALPERQALATRVVRSRGTALIVTSQTPPPVEFAAHRQPPLDQQHSVLLLQTKIGAELPQDALDWIFGRASGNPLFTLEYFRLLARQGYLWNDARHWHWRSPPPDLLPVTALALIERVLTEIPTGSELWQVSSAVALLPYGTDLQTVAEVAGVPPDAARAAQAGLERLGVFARGEFAHPLYREVCLRQLTGPQRQALARQALVVFGADPVRACTFVIDARLEPAVTLAWFEQAAQGAGSEVQAARFRAQAADFASGEPQADLALSAARTLLQYDPHTALELVLLARQTRPDDPEVLWLQAELQAAEGEQAQAAETLASLTRLYVGRGAELAYLGHLIRVRTAAQDQGAVLALWKDHEHLRARPDPEVAWAVAFALARHGRDAEALPLIQAALEQPKLTATTRSKLLNVLGILRDSANDFPASAGYYSLALAEIETAGRPDLEAGFLVNRAQAFGDLGRHRERMADLEACIEIYQRLGQGLQVTRSQLALADARLDAGEYEGAEELLLECRDLLGRLGPSDHLVECEYRLSALYRDWATPHGRVLSVRYAQSALANARLLFSPRKIAWSLAYASMAESRAGGAEQGRVLAEEALALASELGSPGQIGMARFAQAHALEAAGETEAAIAAFEETEAALAALELQDVAHEVGLEADRLAHRADRAQERYAWFNERGMLNLAHITCRYFPELAVPLPSPAGSPPDRAFLERAPGTPGSHGAAPMRLEVLGPFRLGPAGQEQPVRGRKRRELLATLLEGRLRGRPAVPRPELLGAAYAGMDESQATSSLKELVHTTRTAHGPGVIQTTPDGHALGALDSDAAQFLQLGDTRLWRGPYLQDTPLAARDESVQDALQLALLTRSEALLEHDPHEAARTARLLLEADPYSPEALRVTLKALRSTGQHRSLTRLYAAARARLHEVGEVLPERWADYLA